MGKDKWDNLKQSLGYTKAWVGFALVFVLAFFLYFQTVGFEFTQDDAIVIYQNSYTQKGVDGLSQIFKEDSFQGFFQDESKSGLVSGGRYRPLTIGYFAILYQFFGLNTSIYHLSNVIFYALLCLIIMMTIRQLSPQGPDGKTNLFAFATAVLFAVHPIHTEVVANVKGLDEIWSLLWGILSLYFAVRFLRLGSGKYLILVTLFYFLSLMSKESSVVFLLLIPVIAYFSLPGITLNRYISIFAALAIPLIAYVLIRQSILPGAIGAESSEMMNNPFIKVENNSYIPFSSEERTASVIAGLGKYIQLLIFPYPLIHDYYPRSFPVTGVANANVISSLIMNLTLILIMILGLKKRSMISLGIFIFYIGLALTSNIFFPIGTHLSERFLFTSSLGFALILTVVLGHLLMRGRMRKLVVLAFILLVTLSSFMTVERSQTWRDDFTLFQSDVSRNPNSAKLQNAAGGSLIDKALKSNEPQRSEMLAKARIHLGNATRIHPNYKAAHLLNGHAAFYLADYDSSIEYYKTSLQLDPGYEEARISLIRALIEGGRRTGSSKRDYSGARKYLNEALGMDKNNPEVWNLIGVSFGNEGNPKEAMENFNEAVRRAPGNSQYWLNLSRAQGQMGLTQAADISLAKAIEIDPGILNRN